MAGIILHQVPRARVGLFRIPAIAGAVPAYSLRPRSRSRVAAAVEPWRADVVLIAMSDGAWGTPRHLRDVLREAARTGRGGRGAMVCSVGIRPRTIRARRTAPQSAPTIGEPALGNRRRCLRRCRPLAAGGFDYQRTWLAGTTYNRFGPSVALAAPGEAQVYGGVLAADDSSQAAALVAAAAATVCRARRTTTLDDLRAILA